MSFQPYPHQEKCLDAIAEARQRGWKRVLVVMASGLGKTVTAALDAKRWLTRHAGRLLYLCHQNDILEQARATFEAVLGNRYTCGHFHAGSKDRHTFDCLFASFQMMWEWREEFGPREFSYVVVDESHHGPARTYLPTLEYFKPDFLLAMTATPERTDLQDIRKIYGEEVFSLPLDEALAKGILSPVSYFVLTDKVRTLETLDTPVGRLSVKKLNRILFIPRRDKEIARLITWHMRRVSKPRVMVFCPSIAHCECLAAYLPNAVPIHSDFSDGEQKKRLERFRKGLVNVILTVDKFNEGIDVPEANVIVFLRSTASRMIFFQQLGRGLRKVKGKERVYVLDFVANCDRLELVNRLWGDVRGAYERQRQPCGITPLEVDIGHVKFSKVTKRILDVLTAVRDGYTREMLVQYLRELAKKLKRTPKIRDVQEAHKLGKCPDHSVFYRVFGSFKVALEVSGLRKTREVLRSEYIDQIKKLAQELGRKPSWEDFIKASRAGKCGSIGELAGIFGSFTSALEATGFSVQRHRRGKRVKERETLLEPLRNLARELGRVPGDRDVKRASKAGTCPHPTTYSNHFGSLTKALEVAGLVQTTPKEKAPEPSVQEICQQLRDLAGELRKTPTWSDLEKARKSGKCASPWWFYKAFGSIRVALLKAGLSSKAPRGEHLRRPSPEQLCQQLRDITAKINRVPKLRDVQVASKRGECASANKFYEAFGTFPNALKAARVSGVLSSLST